MKANVTVGIVVALLALGAVRALVQTTQPLDTRKPEGSPLPLSCATVDQPGYRSIHPPRPPGLSFEGKQYDPEAGIAALMDVVKDHRAGERRLQALEQLQRVGRKLSGRPCVADLVALYPELADTESRLGLMVCLAASEDERALPLFLRVLAGKPAPLECLGAALGLAQWNERTGVASLMQLLGDDTPLPNRRSVGYEASSSLFSLNTRRAWGFPEDEMFKSLEEMKDLPEETRKDFVVKRWREWFEANQHRFPVFQPDASGQVPGEGEPPQEVAPK